MQDLEPENVESYRKLGNSINASLVRKRSFAEQRMRLLKKLVGPYFGGDGTKEKRPVNMIELGVDILLRAIASRNPQALVQTEFRELMPTAYDFEIVLNRKLDVRRLNIQDSFNICGLESLFNLGVMCVGLKVEHDFDPGKVFAEPVLFPDLILDMNAKSWGTQTYIGHDFTVNFDDIKNSPLYEGRNKDYILRARDLRNRSTSDWQRPSEEYLDQIMLRQLYLPHLNRIIVCDPETAMDKPLMSSEWEGPEGGPYTPLYYKVVSGHVMPLAPVPFWHDLDDIINKCFGKAARQTLRQKTVGLSRNADDATAINNADDGITVEVSDPNAIVEKAFGGANQALPAMVEMAKSLLVYLGGNWDALAGLAPMSGTFGQDKLLSQGASGRVKDMQDCMIAFQSKVISDIAYWMWGDPLTTERFAKKIQGTKYSTDDGMWSPETRSGDFFQYNFTVNPYKLVKRSPEEQAQGIIGIVKDVLLPSLPFMQNGSPVDWEAMFELIAHYGNWPELRQIIRWPQGESMPQREPDMPTKPSTSTRTYERINRPSGMRPGPAVSIAQMFPAPQTADASA